MRGGAAAARVAHNHEVAGSSPAPATKTRARRKSGFCFGYEWTRFCDRDFLKENIVVAGSVE